MRRGQSYNKRWLKARPYSFAMLFVFFVPGLMLSFVRDVQLLPANVVGFLYPYSILPWEKAFVTEGYGGRYAVTDLSHPSILNEQTVVVAFVSFFLVFLVIGLQTWADALFADQSLKNLPTALLMLPTAMLLRCYFMYRLFLGTEAAVLPQPIQWSLMPKIFFAFQQPTHWMLEPAALVLMTCVVAKTIHVIGRIAYLDLAGDSEAESS